MIPDKYVAGLSPALQVLQRRLIEKSQREYEKTGKVVDRPKVSKKKVPRSSHVKRFQEMYGFPITDLTKVKRQFPNADVEKILAKGRAAYASSGSRPNVSSHQWAFARLASALTGGKAAKVDKDLL